MQLNKRFLLCHHGIEDGADQQADSDQNTGCVANGDDSVPNSGELELRLQVSGYRLHVLLWFEIVRVPSKLVADDILRPQVVEGLGSNHLDDVVLLA